MLVNAAGAQEVAAGIEAGADGIGLLRTELAFLESAPAGPRRQPTGGRLEPVVEALGEGGPRRSDCSISVATSALRSSATTRAAGSSCCWPFPEALEAQVAAILDCCDGLDLRLLIPMVRGPADVRRVREVVGARDASRPAGIAGSSGR